MKIIFLLLILLFILTACTESDKNKGQFANKQQAAIPDTVTGKKDLINEVAGSAYLKRATGYFCIAGADTSDFIVVFSENKDDGKVEIDAHYDQYHKKGKLFKMRLLEFSKILDAAQKDYNFDSLASISIGRLVSTGDLAIDITREYLAKFGEDYKIKDYKKITDFLNSSEFAKRFNTILAPYSIIVKDIGAEKIFFTNRHELYYSSLVEADSTQIPERILDCITWIYLGKKQN